MKVKREIPWPRIFAEGAAIVVSILLAFAIQAWWEGANERDEEQRILSALCSEFTANLEQIESELQYRAAANQYIQAIFDAANDQAAAVPDEIDQRLANLFWWGT